jgi:hypothetical protein
MHKRPCFRWWMSCAPARWYIFFPALVRVGMDCELESVILHAGPKTNQAHYESERTRWIDHRFRRSSETVCAESLFPRDKKRKGPKLHELHSWLHRVVHWCGYIYEHTSCRPIYHFSCMSKSYLVEMFGVDLSSVMSSWDIGVGQINKIHVWQSYTIVV